MCSIVEEKFEDNSMASFSSQFFKKKSFLISCFIFVLCGILLACVYLSSTFATTMQQFFQQCFQFYTEYHDSVQDQPNFWKGHGIFMVLGFIFFPRITLVFFCPSISFLWKLTVGILFPELVIISAAIYRGYLYQNYLEITLFLMYTLWKWKAKPNNQPSDENVSEDSAFNSSFQPREYERNSGTSLTTSFLYEVQAKIDSLRKHLEVYKQRTALLNADQTFLESLTSSQLARLREELEERLELIDKAAKTVKSVKSKIFDNTPQTCVICLEATACVELRPCNHNCLCEECFHTAISKARPELECPLCRIPVLSYFFTSNHCVKVSPEQLQEESKQCTENELKKLYAYVKENPSVVEKLRDKSILNYVD